MTIKNLRTLNERFYLIYFAIALVLFAIAFSVSNARAQTTQTIEGNIVRWLDGDTVQFRAKNGKYYRIRLQGIDAPERRQTMGLQCTKDLEDITISKTITATLYGRDTYKRWLGMLAVEGIADLNLWMINRGCAWEYSAPLALKTEYQSQEGIARSDGVGLWADSCPTEPWAFRANGYKICP